METASIQFPAKDGHSLNGLLAAPQTLRAGLLISPATGYPKEFYRRFAERASERGYLALAYDYRGVNTGDDAALKVLEADIEDWGRLDFAGAAAELDRRLGGKPILTLGHSVGGHLIGFAETYDRFAGHIFVSVGSGYWGHHKGKTSLLGLFLWWGYGPLALARHGYLPSGGLWSGTALPKGAFQQWRRWSNRPGYFNGDLKAALRPHHFEDVTAPIRSFIFTDDPIANPRTARTIFDAYPNADKEMRLIAPAEFGLKRIGHDGAFRQKAAPLWDAILDEADALAA